MVQVAERMDNNIFKSFFPAVNSPPLQRDVNGTSSYRPYTEEYTSVQRRGNRHVQPEADPETTKKEKKWSIGKLFRRKKKENESESSSESDEASTRSPSKKKAKKKKRTPAVNNFDHIVIRDTRRAQSLAKPNFREYNDDGVLSDPSAGFINYRTKSTQYGLLKDTLNTNSSQINGIDRLAVETPLRKSRKSRLKARVEAKRNSMKGDSSSEEESLKSSNSSTMIRFRSDDSLMRSRDSSLNKRSRSARNERYIKRLSRDDENQLNKEAELIQQGYTKAEVEMLTRTPTSQSSGYGTCRRDQLNIVNQDQIYTNDTNRRPLKSESVSSFPSTTQSYPSSINFNAKVNNEHINYSVRYLRDNKNKEPLYANDNREHNLPKNTYENAESVMCVRFPLGNVINTRKDEKSPPVPPPRDFHRKVVTPLSMYYDKNSRNNNDQKLYGVPNNDFERVIRRSQERSLGHSINGLRRPISSSEDHIAMQNNEYMQCFQHKNEQPRRPASVSAEPQHYGFQSNTPPWRNKSSYSQSQQSDAKQLEHDFLYYADQSPRSRRPISIKSNQTNSENQYLSDSQSSLRMGENMYRRPKNASDFWKKIDDAEKQRRQQHSYTKSNSNYSSNSQLNNFDSDAYIDGHERLRYFDIHNQNHPNNKSLDTPDCAKIWKATTEYKTSVSMDPQKIVTSPVSKTHIRHKSDTGVFNSSHLLSDEEKNSERRKSTNLDDALNELEAIYNSLGLGDEDLLDRAERRELMTPLYNDWNGNDSEMVLRSQPTTPLRRISRRSTLPDKLQDDMAFRRMNSLPKEKPNVKESQSQISYMLASPVYVPYCSDDDKNIERNEPDIVHDDVVYRTITQTNNRLKTLDPQPPFGIPVGPVSPAPLTDYLHATPENKGRSRFIPRRSPDLVSDDLAYRSLRKDNRHSSIFNGEDFTKNLNNNYNINEYPSSKESPTMIKKKRAVRSLSANIFTMIQKEIDDALNSSKSTLQKTNSNSDVFKRLRDTFENNDNEQEHYPRNKVKQRHNTVSILAHSTHVPSRHFTKDDSYINDDKYLAKNSSCDKSKSSSPSNRSPQTSKRSSKDEFQHVLSILAQEAMDTSNKLGVALAELDKNRNNSEKKLINQQTISDSRTNFLNSLTSKSFDEPITQIKYVNVHSETLPESSSNNFTHDTYIRSTGKKTEDSLLAISDQLYKVEDQLKQSFEKELQLEDESNKLSSYNDKPNEKSKAQEVHVLTSETKLVPDVVPTVIQNDAMNIKSVESNLDISNSLPQITNKSETKSLNPFSNSDEKIDEINRINAFKELKDGISDLIAGISQVNEKLFIPKGTEESQTSNVKMSGITEATQKLKEVSENIRKHENDHLHRGSINLSIYEDDLENKKETADSTEYNSSEELATIFKFENSNKLQNIDEDLRNKKNNRSIKREELNSPKLVQSVNQQLRKLSIDQTDEAPGQSNPQPANIVPWRTKKQSNISQKDNRGDNNSQRKHRWHDTGSLMLACSYTFVLTQQLADLDWLTLIGLILAMITIIAMLLL